jgi:hypothetical protein
MRAVREEGSRVRGPGDGEASKPQQRAKGRRMTQLLEDTLVSYSTGAAVMATWLYALRREYSFGTWQGAADVTLAVILWPIGLIAAVIRSR